MAACQSQSLTAHFSNTLQYPLYYGELQIHRKSSRGTVTVRLRLEFPDMRTALFRGMLPPSPSTVSVARQIDYEMAHYTTDGLVDDDKFSITTMTRYIEEVEELAGAILDKVKEAAMSVSSILFVVLEKATL
jgi:1-deoxy-D-xylulose 5-phosphate reductoisomerase